MQNSTKGSGQIVTIQIEATIVQYLQTLSIAQLEQIYINLRLEPGVAKKHLPQNILKLLQDPKAVAADQAAAVSYQWYEKVVPVIASALAGGSALGSIIIGIDNFKRVNLPFDNPIFLIPLLIIIQSVAINSGLASAKQTSESEREKLVRYSMHTLKLEVIKILNAKMNLVIDELIMNVNNLILDITDSHENKPAIRDNDNQLNQLSTNLKSLCENIKTSRNTTVAEIMPPIIEHLYSLAEKLPDKNKPKFIEKALNESTIKRSIKYQQIDNLLEKKATT